MNYALYQVRPSGTTDLLAFGSTLETQKELFPDLLYERKQKTSEWVKHDDGVFVAVVTENKGGWEVEKYLLIPYDQLYGGDL